jgi:DNA-binding response OmpR family regulator
MSQATHERLLVVDDNEMNRDLLQRRLERQGYEVTIADNGARALELIQSERFDLVLLDIMMPKMNGYEVLEHVKNDPRLRAIPIIMISAVDDLESVVRCIELGAEDYLFKPFNPVLLKARITATLDKKRLREGTYSQTQIRPALDDLQRSIEDFASGRLGSLNHQQETLLDQMRDRVDQLVKLLES